MALVRLLAFADNDTTADAPKVLEAMMKVENVAEFEFVGDGPYSKDSSKWIAMMKKYFTDTKKLRLSQGNHEHKESESQEAEDQIEEWIPSLKNADDQLDWLSAGQVGNVYVICGNTQDLRVEFEDKQFNWLKSELQKAKQLRAEGKIDWIVYMCHKPFFTLKTSHSPYTGLRFSYKDIFRDAQVDFVLHGHNHNTQLWKPMIPNENKANAEGEALFSLAADGKTFDFTKDHGACYIVTGHAGHEWNPIKKEQNDNVMHYRDSGLFGFTQLDFDGKKANVKSIDSSGKVHFEYAVSREGSGSGPVEPEPCKQGECKDPITKKCRPIGLNEQRDFKTGECIPIDQPPEPEAPKPTCPEGYELVTVNGKCECKKIVDEHGCGINEHWSNDLQRCIPDLEPPFQKCDHGSHWDYQQNKCVLDQEPEKCPDGYHWNEATQSCEKDIIIDPDPTGEIDANGLKWLVGKGTQTLIKQSRDEATDDRWSGNVKGLRNGFEATMIAKGTGTNSSSHFAMKQFGGNHSGSGASSQRWYDNGLRVNGAVQLQWEGPHPKNHDYTLPDSKWFIKKISKTLEGNWIGLKWACQTMVPNGSPAKGGVRVRMWVDEDPLDAEGKPKNNWKLVIDFIDGIDAKVIQPQTYEAPDECDMEVRRSDTKTHEVFKGGLHVRAL